MSSRLRTALCFLLLPVALLAPAAGARAETPVRPVSTHVGHVRPRLAATAAAGVAARLPSGRRLAPVGRIAGTGVMPTGVAYYQGHVAVLTSGPTRVQSVTLYAPGGLTVQSAVRVSNRRLSRGAGKDDAAGADGDDDLEPVLPEQSFYQGLAAGPGGMLFAAGGDSDDLLAMRLEHGRLQVVRRYALRWQPFPRRQFPYRYQGMHDKPRHFYADGVCAGRRGRYVYATGLMANSLARVDLRTGHVDYLNAGPYPFTCAVTGDGERVVVSDWGGNGLTVVDAARFVRLGHIALGAPEGPGFGGAGPHPTALAASGAHDVWVTLSNADRVAEVDTVALKVERTLEDSPHPGAPPGTYPDGVAEAGSRLYVANAGDNTVAVFDALGGKRLGLIPAGWYPTALAAGPHALYVAAGKGMGAGANSDHAWLASMTNGALQRIGLEQAAQAPSAWTRRALEALGMDAAARRARKQANTRAAAWLRRHIHRVVFILRENKTYDEEFGRYKPAAAWGDPRLALYDRRELPNLYKLAGDGALFTRFYVNGEVTAAGHQWTTGASESDWVQRTWPSYYSGRGIAPNPGWTQPLFKAGFDAEGRPRGDDPYSDYENLDFLGDYANPWISYPQRLYLFDDLLAHHVSFEDFGEFVSRDKMGDIAPTMREHLAFDYPAWDRMLLDTQRAAVAGKWFAQHADSLPRFLYVWLPDDHTAGTNPCYYTPDFYVADNDLATARVVAALSRLPDWKHTLVFITEDDTQSGADHLSAFRSFLVMVGPWVKPGALVTRHYSQVDVMRTVEAVFGLPPLSQWDANARVIDGPWRASPDAAPFVPEPEAVAKQRNPGACHSRWQNLRRAAGRQGRALTAEWLDEHGRTPDGGAAFGPTELLSTPGPEMMRQEWIGSRGLPAWRAVVRYLRAYAGAHGAPLARYLAEGED